MDKIITFLSLESKLYAGYIHKVFSNHVRRNTNNLQADNQMIYIHPFFVISEHFYGLFFTFLEKPFVKKAIFD